MSVGTNKIIGSEAIMDYCGFHFFAGLIITSEIPCIQLDFESYVLKEGKITNLPYKPPYMLR
jgi:hypothetical protein